MKKLAIVTTHPIQYYAPIFKLLAERGVISIKVFYTWGEGSLHKHDPGFGHLVEWDIPLLDGYPFEWVINTSVKPGSGQFNGIVNPGLIRQIDGFQPDAILVFGWAYQSHLKVMRHFKNKIPVYFRGDSTLLNERPGPRSLFKTIALRWIYRYVDHAFYVGTNNKAYFKKYGLKESQLEFAPHAIDNDRFKSASEKTVDALKKKLGIEQHAVTVVFAGKLEATKSPLLLLKSFLSIHPVSAHLIFVGDGAFKSLLVHEAAGQPNVHFLNFMNQSEMPVIYHAADLFCLPSVGESWGLVVNEAMAAGKAILVSDKVGCAVDLVGTDNGLIFKAGSQESLTACLRNLIHDKGKLVDRGSRSRLRIKDWTFLKVVTAIENKLKDDSHCIIKGN